METNQEHYYWTKRYEEEQTGWDIGYPSTPVKTYIDQLEDRSLKILIPGAGNAWEAEYLFEQGFRQVYVLDISAVPLKAFAQRLPHFPKEQLIQGDFFEHEGQYDLIFEQTFFCSFPPIPEDRHRYAQQMARLLKQGGKLVGLWFNIPLTDDLEKRPFGGDRQEYLSYLLPHFQLHTFENCYNSIPPRADNELFGIFQKKE